LYIGLLPDSTNEEEISNEISILASALAKTVAKYLP